MKKSILASCLAISTLSFNVVANLAPTAIVKQAAPSKQNLANMLSTLENMSANFHQTIVDVDGNVLQEGQGNFVLAKPDLVKWQTVSPDESTITSDGETLWLFDPFIEQVTAYSLAKSIVNTPILLLTSTDDTLWQQYNINQKNATTFEVIAKDSNAQVKQLTLSFKQGVLNQFIIFDATGQQSQFTLTDIKANQEIDTAIFKFELPEGVLLDDQR